MRKNSRKSINNALALQCVLEKEDRNLALTEYRREAHEIAKEANVSFSDIYIYYHDVVGEHCIEIKGRWSGYLDGWRDQGHVVAGRFA